MLNSIHVGVIGAGMAAIPHLKAYRERPDVRIAAIADPNRDLLAHTAEYQPETTYETAEELLAHPGLDLVDICLPHFLHREMALAAFEKRLNVLIEKPIALTVAEADEMIAAAKKNDCRFFVSLNQRFLPIHRKAKELLDAGAIGTPYLALVTVVGDEFERMMEPGLWKATWDRAGGGAFADTGTHVIDILHDLFGLPTNATGQLRKLRVTTEDRADDTCFVTLDFEGGVTANVVVTYAATTDAWREEKHIYGTTGSLHMANEEAENPLWIVRDKGGSEYVPVDHDADWWTYSIKIAVNHFLDCLVSGATPLVTARQARDVLATIEGVYNASSAQVR